MAARLAPPVAVIGAGYAGLACAVELARTGIEVAVFERSHVLGGRARVVRKPGFNLDNGQHLLLGAYHELLRLMRMVGVPPRRLHALPLTLHTPDGRQLRAARLPAPLHLAVGLLRARGFAPGERRRLVSLMMSLRREGWRVPSGQTVAELLKAHQQPPALIDGVWAPLCLAALNTPPDRACARVFACVLRDALGGSAADSEMLIPATDLSELFPVAAVRYLATRRGRVMTGNAISAIRKDGSVFRLSGDGNRSRHYTDVVVATAPQHAGALLAPFDAASAALLARIEYFPITTVYLQLAPPPSLPVPIVSLGDGPLQWLFSRTVAGGPPDLFAGVISAHDDALVADRDALIDAARAQIGRWSGVMPQVVWSQVITEKRATFGCTPDRPRPAMATGEAGLWLAGDYLDADYPATLESAVRSGVRAARAIIARRGESDATPGV